MLPLTSKDREYSRRNKIKDKISGWLRLIFADKTSRNLLMFLILNLSFAFVELLYGIWSNSLGLISDSFHMFFDCTALLAGLAASVISKWRADDKFSYGYVRAEVLAGFINGLFLLFISFFIFSEAVERAVEPPEVKHERLFIVSVLGFLVNLIGIFAFHHGHGHGHSHDGGHGHSHGGHSHSAVDQPVSSGGDKSNGFLSAASQQPHAHSHGAAPPANHAHSHSHNPHGSHRGEVHAVSDHMKLEGGGHTQISQGVFLHILADTLGSVGVIFSSILMHYFGWMIADPICSMFIAVLIGFSVIPLLRDSVGVLMQRQPRELDYHLPSAYQRVAELDGVYSVQEPHFWTLCSDVYVGAIKVEASTTADARYITSQTHNIFAQIGVRQLYVQVDYVAV